MMMKIWHNGVAWQTQWAGVFYWWNSDVKMWFKRDSQKWAREDYEIIKRNGRVEWVKMINTNGIILSVK